jgi:hypothetical protein
MAHDSLGTKNQPGYNGGGIPADAADLTEISEYAALVGNHKVLDTTTRLALTGNELWEGLMVYDLTLERLFQYMGATLGWMMLEGNAVTKVAISANVNLSAAATALPWTSASPLYPSGWTSGAPSRLVLPAIGLWEVQATVTTTNASDKLLRAQIYKNGAAVPDGAQNVSGSSGITDPFSRPGALVEATALTDYVELYISANSTTSTPQVVAGQTSMWARYLGLKR